MVEPLYAPGPQRTRYTLLNEYEAPLSKVLGATLEETVARNPVPSAYRAAILAEAKNITSFELKPEFQDESFVDQLRLSLDENNRRTRKFLDAREARQRVEEARVPIEVPDEGITEEALNILIRRKREEQQRQQIISRAPSGFFPAAAQIGVALGASVLDPLNVASAFIPVVGQARYAQMLRTARTPLARAGVRARVGAVEGAVGAAVVEPIVLGAALYEQADYDLTDSMLNLAFGSVFGGGLHAGFGAIGDAFSRTGRDGTPTVDAPDPDTARRAAQTRVEGRNASELNAQPVQVKEQLIRSAVGQLADGRYPDVTVVGDFGLKPASLGRLFVEGSGFREVSKAADELFQSTNPTLYRRWSMLRNRLDFTQRRLTETGNQPVGEQIAAAVAPLDEQIADLRRRSVGKKKRLQKKFDSQIAELEAQKAKIETEFRSGKKASVAELQAELQKVQSELEDISAEVNIERIKAQDTVDNSALPQVEYEFRYKYVEDTLSNPALAQQKIADTFSVERGITNDPQAAMDVQRHVDDPEAEFDIDTPEAAERYFQDTLELLEEDFARRGLEMPDLTAERALIQQVDEYNRGLDAGFVCGIRRGE